MKGAEHMRRSVYYGAGIFCLAASAMILLNTNILPFNLANNVAQVQHDSGYKDYYHIGFPLPGNSLRRGTVYLPVYSAREREQLWQMILPFAMGDAEIVETDEYFETSADGETLRIYRYIDLLEYENMRGDKAGGLIDGGAAQEVAQGFLEDFLPHKKPYAVTVRRDDDGWAVRFAMQLSGLANNAFPTDIEIDKYGNVVRVSHYFFEYEALGDADVITVRAALAQLPREEGRRVHLNRYELVYGFEDSVLVPVYWFYGKCAEGVGFEESVGALRFY